MQLEKYTVMATLKLIRSLVFSVLIVGGLALAERPADQNPLQYIVGGGQIGYSQGGAVALPMSVIGALKQGQISPIMQFALINNTMTKCIKKVVSQAPFRRDPFVSAKAKFTTGFCKIKKCFEQNLLLSMLPQLSSNPSAGGSTDSADRNGAQMMGLALAQAFQKEESCTAGTDNGIDPILPQQF